MLILRRNPGESIMIADSILVKVLKDASGGVHLGIDAPKNIKIVRTELLQNVETHSIKQRSKVKTY